MTDKIIFITAILANIVMIFFALFQAVNAYGGEAGLALLLLVPPVLSLAALCQTGGMEERKLRRAVRKASLRKQLKELESYTTD